MRAANGSNTVSSIRAQSIVSSPIVWKIQPSEPGALSAFAAALSEVGFPGAVTLERAGDEIALSWDPCCVSSATVRNAAIAAAGLVGCSVRAISLSSLSDRQRAAVAAEVLDEPHLRESSILEAAIERSWAR